VVITAIKPSSVHASSLGPRIDLPVLLKGQGTISLLQIHLPRIHHAYLVDVAILQDVAFTHSVSGISLHTILEDPKRVKLLWDCRADVDALYGLYKVKLAGVVDVQLMDCITRSTAKEGRTVKGLSMALLQRMNELSYDTKEAFQNGKYWGNQSFNLGLNEIRARYDKFAGNARNARTDDWNNEQAQSKRLKAIEAGRLAYVEHMATGNGRMTLEIQAYFDHMNIELTLTPTGWDVGKFEKNAQPNSTEHVNPDYPTGQQYFADYQKSVVVDGGYTWIEMPNKDPFAVRPLPEMLKEYAVGDVYLLGVMRKHYLEHQTWTDEVAKKVEVATLQRLEEARAKD
jgi:hypothetical protein